MYARVRLCSGAAKLQGLCWPNQWLDLFKDLLKMYEPDIADSIIANKTAEGLWAPHPECPSAPKMILYWVRLVTTLTVEDELEDRWVRARGAFFSIPFARGR